MSGGAVAFQIGKAGVNSAVIEQLNRLLEHHKHIRITLLPSSGRNRTTIRQIAEELTGSVSFSCEYRIIGFTIALRKKSSTSKERK